jgi:hypothetical protein
MTPPKLFISYCWSDAEHEQWVVEFATALRESGVDVILDKWDLKEGHDALAFMEKMVTDPHIKKVAIICDEKYALKADGRSGGVGTETQIISPRIYENTLQEKFVAVVRQRDHSGKPYLPTYYKSRIYIDLVEAESYSENFDRLLRWIFDKPLYVKPEIGAQPAFLSAGDSISLGTTPSFRRCLDLVKSNKPNAGGAVDEYFALFTSNLERFRISKSAAEFDEDVIKSVSDFLPYRNEAIQLLSGIAVYSPTEEFVLKIHRWLEGLIPFMFRPAGVSQWQEWDFDNYRFIVHELFLWVLAIFLKHERFEQASKLVREHYLFPGNAEQGGEVMVNYFIFQQHLNSLDHRNQRLNLRRVSIQADLLKDRCIGTGVEFRYLMQADFVAFMRGEMGSKSETSRWWPETLVFLGYSSAPFEVFARSISSAFFKKMKILLGIEAAKELEPVLALYRAGSRRLPKWGFNGVNPEVLLNYANLATAP